MSPDVAFGEDRVLVGEIVAGLGECLGNDLHDSAAEHHAIERRDRVEGSGKDDAFLVQGFRIPKGDLRSIHGSSAVDSTWRSRITSTR